MAELKNTPEQQAAISSKGKVIVSASAGSGKTYVMIQKILSLLLDGAETSDFLAVTFTKKAAAGMVEKLRDALIKAENAESDEKKKAELKRKISSLCMADISTIHAFCSRLLRSYFYLVGIDASFDIIGEDDSVGREIFDTAMEKMLEEAYASGDEDFSLILDCLPSKMKNKKIIETIGDIYKELRSDRDYRENIKSYACFTQEKFDKMAQALGESVKAQVLRIQQKTEELYPSVNFKIKDLNEVYNFLTSTMSAILSQRDIFGISQMEYGAVPKKGTAKKGVTEQDIDVRTRLNEWKDQLVKLLKETKNYEDRETEQKRYFSSGKLMQALYKYVEKFDEEYSELKRKRSKLDYNDLEHYALQVLKNEEALRAVKGRYRYVFVDEYQDVNPIQEQLIATLASNEVFLVGDNKQAIYSFRGSKSFYFNQKTEEFSAEQREDAPTGSLSLNSNFRSAANILTFVNQVFSAVMTKENCGINYIPVTGGTFYDGHEGVVQVHTLPKKQKETASVPQGVYTIESLVGKVIDYKTPQGEVIRSIIRSCVGDGKEECPSADPLKEYYDLDEKKMKRVTYGDIAILARSVNNEGVGAVIRYLTSEGIPVTSLAKVNVCDYPEVKRLINILQYIDNPEDDVTLCASLLSSVGGCDENDLAHIKIAGDERAKAAEHKDEVRTFRADTVAYAEEKEDERAEKLKRFFQNVQKLRSLSHVLTAGEIINAILSDYEMETNILAMDNGNECMARINRFASETNGNEFCVHDFLTRLKNADFIVNYTENNGENSVKVLTIHASKGLEYPVVILAGAEKPFHGVDECFLKNGEDGFVPDCFDTEKMIRYKTVFRRYTAMRLAREQVDDELNLFYVALTRAKYALHLVSGKEITDTDYEDAHCFADYLKENTVRSYLTEDNTEEVQKEEGSVVPAEEYESELEQLKSVYCIPYPYEDSVNLSVKSSATALLKREEKDEEYFVTAHPFVAVEEEGCVDNDINADVGTAYHAFLQHARFGEEGQYERARDLLPEEQFELLSKSKCESILSLPIFKRLSASTLCREQKFLVKFPANKFEQTSSQDEIIYQGAIDLLVVGENGVEIVDYKYSGADKETIKKHYMPQLLLYRAAAAKLMKIEEKTIGMTIVNIRRGEVIPMD